jgi:peptidoglycan/LPS O-acetylase OafA/YrhL
MSESVVSGPGLQAPGAVVAPFGAYVARLDGVRAIAISLVLSVHCVRVPEHGTLAWAVRNTLSNGWIGVDLFFVLSGFLITRILINSKPARNYFRNFYVRRFLRIMPPYYLLLVLLVMLSPMLGLGPFKNSWIHFAYLSNLNYALGVPAFLPVSHSWSLAVEEQYYLFFPLVVWIASVRSLKRILWGAVLLCPLIRLVVMLLEVKGGAYFLTICRLDALAMGGLIAIYLMQGDQKLSSGLAGDKAWKAFLAAALTVMAIWLGKGLDFRLPAFSVVGLTIVDGACALFLLAILLRPQSLTSRILASRPMVAIGKVSYGVYLYHLPVYFVLSHSIASSLGDSWVRTLVLAVTSIGASLGLAFVSWRYFEVKILSLKRYFGEADPHAGKERAYAPA